MKRALDMDSGDSCATLWMQMNWTLKNGEHVNLMFCAFYHNKKKKRETDQEDSHMNREDTQVPLGKLSPTNP